MANTRMMIGDGGDWHAYTEQFDRKQPDRFKETQKFVYQFDSARPLAGLSCVFLASFSFQSLYLSDHR